MHWCMIWKAPAQILIFHNWPRKKNKRRKVKSSQRTKCLRITKAVKCAYATLFPGFPPPVTLNIVKIDSSSLDGSRHPASCCSSNVRCTFFPTSKKGRAAQTKDRFTAVMGNCMRSSYSKMQSNRTTTHSTRRKSLPSLFPLGLLVSQLILASRPPNAPSQSLIYPDMAGGSYQPISRTRVEGVRERLENGKVAFRNYAAGDVMATAWRTNMTWSRRLPKNNNNVACLSTNVIGNSVGLVETRGEDNRG